MGRVKVASIDLSCESDRGGDVEVATPTGSACYPDSDPTPSKGGCGKETPGQRPSAVARPHSGLPHQDNVPLPRTVPGLLTTGRANHNVKP